MPYLPYGFLNLKLQLSLQVIWLIRIYIKAEQGSTYF